VAVIIIVVSLVQAGARHSHCAVSRRRRAASRRSVSERRFGPGVAARVMPEAPPPQAGAAACASRGTGCSRIGQLISAASTPRPTEIHQIRS
jgi:hypothetical protein